MKTVKKLLKIVGILVFLLILSLVTIPILFKDQIVEKVKEIANASVNAKVDFGDFDLSLIASFPSFTFEINDVSVINKAPFDGDTLAHIGNINLELDLGSVINGRYVVSSFNINDLTANAKVLKDGKANSFKKLREDLLSSSAFYISIPYLCLFNCFLCFFF